MDWLQWIQDSMNELMGYLEQISESLEKLAKLAEDEAKA